MSRFPRLFDESDQETTVGGRRATLHEMYTRRTPHCFLDDHRRMRYEPSCEVRARYRSPIGISFPSI
jgi:hypothetical protein